MSAADAFKPAGGGKEISVIGGPPAPSAELGQHFRTQQQPAAMQQAPMKVGQGGDAFVPTNGTAPVRMGDANGAVVPQDISQAAKPAQGPAVPRTAAFQPAQQTQMGGAPLAPQPFPQRPEPAPAPEQLGGTDKYAVYIDGIGPDGAPLTTEPIVTHFPAGSTLSGMRYDKLSE